MPRLVNESMMAPPPPGTSSKKAGGFLSSLKGKFRSAALGLGRALDTALSVLSPSRALGRHCDRERFNALTAFDAARRDRTVNDWSMDRLSPDQAVIPEMGDVTARARAAVRNDWAGRAIISAYQRHVVGTGLKPMAAAVDSAGKLRTKFNKQMDRLWRRWARNPKLVDSEKTKTFNAMLRLAESEWVTAGQCFLVRNYKKRREGVGLSLTMYELEQLANEGDCEPRAGNEMRGGVECARGTGEAVAYWFYTKNHPLETMSFPGSRLAGDDKPTRIEAERVIHLHRQTRPGETLSPSRLSASLYKMHGQKRYDDNEQLAKGIESFLGFVIKRNSDYGVGGQIGFGPPSGETAGPTGDSLDAGGNRVIDFESGAVPVLYNREEVQLLNPTRPGPHYGDYMDRQNTFIAAGAELSYAMMTHDMSKGNFSSQRQGRLDDEALIDIDQQELEDLVVRVVWQDFVEACVMEGRVQAPGFYIPGGGINEDWTEQTIRPPARKPVDPAKDAAAKKMRLDMRLQDRGSMLQEEGVDVRDRFEAIAEQSADAKSKGIKLPEEQALEQQPKVSPSEPKPRGKAAKPRSMGEALAQAYEGAKSRARGKAPR